VYWTLTKDYINIVWRVARVGETPDIDPGDPRARRSVAHGYNSPFEEFALLMELRAGQNGPPGIRIPTQKPLAIYVPSERLQLWQTGRSESKIAAKLARHPGVELDILRQYVLLYGWVKGLDLTEVAELWKLEGAERQSFLTQGMEHAIRDLAAKGYRVVDMKPQHVIVRPREKGRLRSDRLGRMLYAVVDYELMERTPEHEEAVRGLHRRYYLEHMARRFEGTPETILPPHLKAMNVLGVDYIYGHAGSTGGQLWVVGRDPDLFNYFLPERWRRTPKEQLSPRNDVFGTRTKDNINLVWRVSRMGEAPTPEGDSERDFAAREHGYNSPFEEFAWALELDSRGVRCVFPRAIYSTGHKAGAGRVIANESRYHKFAHLVTANSTPILSREHEYVTLWGFWSGPGMGGTSGTAGPFSSLDLRKARETGIVSPEETAKLIEWTREDMARAGFELIDLKPDHLLVCVGADGRLVMAANGKPEMRLCNFELLRHLASEPVSSSFSGR
jgi:hypothetical protein